MKFLITILFCVGLFPTSEVLAQAKSKYRLKKPVYEEVDFEEMIRRYFGKHSGSYNSLEGIYSVSCIITKTSVNFLTGRESVRVVERKDNYARVAIMKDWPGSKRDFIEVTMSYHIANKYPIVGEFTALAEGKGILYKHIEPDGSTFSYSMIFDSSELLEGEFSDMHKRKTITYKLSYLKIYPKATDMAMNP
ncbi:MAG: hypothetical protein JNM57_05435 [Cyclobacteriaceae bacterium]|nr:hypothetical protein [Cyclobacteriaceae bacterium]